LAFGWRGVNDWLLIRQVRLDYAYYNNMIFCESPLSLSLNHKVDQAIKPLELSNIQENPAAQHH
jgi:hypothetical protein